MVCAAVVRLQCPQPVLSAANTLPFTSTVSVWHSHQLLEYSADLIFIRNLFLSVVYTALSSEIVFWFCCFVLYVILTLLFTFIIWCASVASNKYCIHTYIHTFHHIKQFKQKKRTKVDVVAACCRSHSRMEWSQDAEHSVVSSTHATDEMPSAWPDSVINGTWF